jgi:cytochrome c6
MKRFALALAILFTAGVAAADTPAAAEIFAKRCAGCHGKDGKGGTPMAQKLAVKDISALASSEDEIEKAIEGGKGKMPAFKGKITDAEIESLAKYIKAGLK